jgi:dCMP deaminase
MTNPYGETTLHHLECGWDHFFLSQAFFVSGKSKDPSTQCGCVVASTHNDIMSWGWNDLTRGIAHKPERHERPLKYLWTEHAERNAIYNAGRKGVPLLGARIFVTRMPCPDCARAVIQSGISRLVSCIYDDELEWIERCRSDVAYEELSEAGVTVTTYAPEIAEKLSGFRYVEG